MRDGNDRPFRLAVRVVQQVSGAQRLALEPILEARRSQQIVQLHGEFHPIFWRKHRIERHHADLGKRRRLNAPDEPREVEVAPFCPCGRQQIGQQDVFAAGDGVGVDAEQREHTSRGRVDTFAERLAIFTQCHWRRDKRAQQRQWTPRRATRGINGHIGGILQALNARTVLTPTCESIFPQFCLRFGERIRCCPSVRRLLRINPRAEIGRRKIRES